MKKSIFFFMVAIFLSCFNTYAQKVSKSFNDSVKGNAFGQIEEQNFNFTGQIYYLTEKTIKLPDFDTLTPVGKIYTEKLNIRDQSFRNGFPGVTDRFEFFAIDYKGRFLIKDTCSYCFALGSDDGSKLFIDDSLLINNDFEHSLLFKRGCLFLQKGLHDIEVQYFQGPRDNIALMLLFRKKSDKTSQIFDLTQFYPITIRENGDSVNVEISDEILFEFNSSELSDVAREAIGNLKRILLEQTKFKSIIVEGHTDDIGSNDYNLKLSRNRAKSVKNLLVELGIDSGLIITKGYGKSRPKFPNTSDDNRNKNRRIEMTILKL